MKKFIAAFALLFMLGTAHAEQQQLPPPLIPFCMETTQEAAQSYTVIVHQMAVLIAEKNGTEELRKKLTPVENKRGAAAIRELYSFAAGNSKCWNVSKIDTLIVMKTVALMIEYIQSKEGLEKEFIGRLVANLGQERTAKAFEQGNKMMENMINHVRAKVTQGSL